MHIHSYVYGLGLQQLIDKIDYYWLWKYLIID